jgi:SET domain-containing protein
VSAKIGAVPEQPASSWLNPKLSVRESPIAGLGVFALAPVERGEECCRLAGELMTDKRFRVYVADRARYSALAVDEGLHLVQSDGDPTTKGNHSCDPNMWLADSVTVVARRPIAAGDEATIDYALLTVDPTWSMASAVRPCAESSSRARTGAYPNSEHGMRGTGHRSLNDASEPRGRAHI